MQQVNRISMICYQWLSLVIYIAKNCERVMKVGTKDILKQRKIEKLHTDAFVITYLKFKSVSKM